METGDLKKLLKYKYEILLGAIILISLFVSVKYISIDSVWPDEAFYAWNGYDIIRNPMNINEEVLKTPSYVFFILIGIFSLFVDKFIATKLVVILFSIIGIIATYMIGVNLKNRLVGLLAAGFMAFNPIVMFLTSRALTDIPIAAMMAVCFLALLKYEEEKHWKWGVILGLCVAFTFYTKISGIILIPIIGLYFIITRKSKIFSDFKNKKFLAFGVLCVLTFIPFVIYNLFKFGSLLPGGVISDYAKSYFFEQGPLYYIISMPQFISLMLIPFLLIGLFFIGINLKKKKQMLMLIWLTVGFIIISIIGEKDFRYLGPIIPILFLCVGYGISQFNLNKKIELVLIGLSIFFMVSMFTNGITHIEYKAQSYMGFRETGDWLNTFVKEDSIIYAGSIRSIRSFSNMEYEEYGGNLRYLPQNISTFEKEVENKTNIFVVVDSWEYTQPEWIYPLSQEKVNTLINLGFNINHIVERDLQGSRLSTVLILSK